MTFTQIFKEEIFTRVKIARDLVVRGPGTLNIDYRGLGPVETVDVDFTQQQATATINNGNARVLRLTANFGNNPIPANRNTTIKVNHPLINSSSIVILTLDSVFTENGEIAVAQVINISDGSFDINIFNYGTVNITTVGQIFCFIVSTAN